MQLDRSGYKSDSPLKPLDRVEYMSGTGAMYPNCTRLAIDGGRAYGARDLQYWDDEDTQVLQTNEYSNSADA